MRQLNSPEILTGQPSMFQPGGLSPMQISPLSSPTEQIPVSIQPPTFQAQPRTFQSSPKAPSFQSATFSPSPSPMSQFTMPAPKSAGRQSRRLSAKRGEIVNDPHYNPQLTLASQGIDTTKTGFVGNIESLSKINQAYRAVVYTTDNMQLVLMSLRAGEKIGSEIHRDSDQFFRIETGSGIVEIEGVRRAYQDGTAILVPKGTQHNVIARTETKLYTIYSPPHHAVNKIEPFKQ